MSTVNTSGLAPLGRAVLVEPYEPEIQKSSIVLPPDVRQRTIMVETRARVIQVGPACWPNEPQPRARAGDLVFISRYSGFLTEGPKDKKSYRLVNDDDIFCGIEE